MFGSMKNEAFEILKQRFEKGEIGRRDLLKGMALLGVGALALKSGAASAKTNELVLVTWGGDATRGVEEAFVSPFSAASGITVKSDGSGPSEGAVQAQAASGKITWDVMHLEYFSSVTLGKQGLLGDIDYNVVDKNKLLPGAAHQWGIANGYNSYVLVYNAQKYADNPPRSWADFFDVEKFPGKRAFPKWMIGVPEAALIADGVSPDALYPLDLDRAFAKIKALMPHVATVWSSGAESQQIMLDGDADMAILWGTRAILVDRDTDQQVTFTFQDAFLAPDAWGYMKGNPAGAENANKFMASTQDPAAQVKLLELIGFGPANPEAATLVPEELKRIDCTQPEHRAMMHVLDMDWYSDNYAAALDKFTAVVGG